MATYEKKGHMTYIHENGNKTILYPVTKMDCVDGLDEALSQLAEDTSGSGIYTGNEAPDNAPENALWLDLDADGTMTALEAGSITITGTANRKISPSGAILVNGTENHLISQDIPVVPGEQYLLTCSANWENSLYAIYDSNGGMKDNLISPTEAAGRSEVNLLVTIPIGGAFMRVAWNKSVPNAAPFAVTKIKIPKSLDGIAVTVIGDSLVEKNNSAKVNFVDIIAFETGANVTNLGEGGTGYMATTDEGEPFYQRATKIPEGTERVLIYGSGNDRKMKLGTPADTGTDTLCGCINATIDAVYARVPTAWVGIIAPAPWKEYPPYGEKTQFELMVQAQQRICARRGIPFLDLYHASGLRPWDDTFRELAFDTDGVHPNDTGHALIAPQIQAFLLGAVGGGAVAPIPDSSQNGDGLTAAEKSLILSLFKNAAYTADMSETITQLETLWSGGEEEPDEPVTPEATLTSISASYSGGGVEVGTAVTALTGVTVTAHYSDGTSKAVTGYTLSGTIAKGENTITVSYEGKTATFVVVGVSGSGGGGDSGNTDTTDETGHVTVTGATAIDDGAGNVTVAGLTATDDGNGNITVTAT